MRLSQRYIIFSILITILGWLLTACGLISSTRTQPTFTANPSPTVTATLTPTITPSPTPLPPMAVLLAPAGADEVMVNSLQTALNPLITSAGLRWQVRQSLSTGDFTPALRLVVAVPPDAGISGLAASAPGTQFLAIAIPGVEAAPNLTVIGTAGDRPDQQGFIAGIIAAMVSPDWREGVISLSDIVDGRSARTGFLNGVKFYCGLCRPIHPPFYEYPLYFELPSTATPAEWQEAANYLVDHFAQAVYVYPGAGDEAMLTVLAEAGVKIISSGEPPEAVASSWIVSLDTDPLALIQEQVSALLDGNQTGGVQLAIPIQFTPINPDVFTPGKQALAEQTLDDLQNGYIDSGVDLTTGENHP